MEKMDSTRLWTTNTWPPRSSSVLIVSGPSFARGAAPVLPPRHVDILPTLLHLARLPIARDLEGRVLDELLTAEVRARKPREIDAYPAYRPAPRRRENARDLTILDDLRSLGYIN